MNDQKHTQGPWHWRSDGMWNGLTAADGTDLLFYTTRDDGVHCENAADALLIAAAPELLEALEGAERKLAAYVGVCAGDKELTEAILPAARAAIAKAKGEPQADPGHTGGTRPAIDPTTDVG